MKLQKTIPTMACGLPTDMETQTIVAVLFVLSLWYARALWNSRKLNSIQTIGPSGPLTSYIGALRFLRHGNEMLEEGYKKYHGSIFKIPTLKSWVVVVTSRTSIDELLRAADDVLSARAAIKELLHSDITLGPELHDDPFHVEAVKGPLTKNIGARFSDVQDEIAVAFNDYIPAKGDEWTQVTALTTVLDIVCRVSNRMLVGLPLCRNADWIDLNKTFTVDMVIASVVLDSVPARFRPIVARFLRRIPKGLERGAKHLEPLFTERLEQEEQNGNEWAERPNDIISWLFEVTEDRQRNMQDLVTRVLLTNFAAIHTTTMAFTYVLFELATRPEYVQPLREEVEVVIKEEGWTKDSMRKLRKMDSFIKESMRLSGFRMLTMERKVMKDFTFSDGTTVPAGYIISVPYTPVHTDANNYVDPGTFDGFRFAKMREQDSENMRHQIVSLDTNYVLFGHGRHACPGRFFVANELKALLSHVLLNYDVKMEDGKGRPKNWQLGYHSLPDVSAKVLFRKRNYA